MKLLVRLSVFLLAASCTPQAQDKPSEKQVAWLTEHAVAFDTAEAGNGFEDLQAFGEMVGDARIVALGEGTHGTREYFQMKHRLTEYLASEKGFTIFSIEASMPEAYRINDYVLGGEGDAAELIGGMYFWTWNTREVLEMVEWMRRFNQGDRGRIEFTGFDMQFPNVAAQNVLDFLSQADLEMRVRLEKDYGEIIDSPRSASSFSVMTASFPVERARGKKVRFSGYIKTEDVQGGHAGLWWRVDGKDRRQLGFDNMADRGPRGTTDWALYQIELDVPEDAVNINYGALLPGSGKAWFDSLKIELDGVEQDVGFETGFESDPQNVFLRGAWLDKEVAYGGSQSLRMERNAEDEGRSKKAHQAAVRVLGELETARERFAESRGRKETEWAIQNARVVAQCMEARQAGAGAARDKSMAENVRWILQQNPSAKIVLWAHNGHIWRFLHAMGSHLAEWYGGGYLPVGFAAGGGQYYAMPGGSGKERIHDLKPPVEGSFESFFEAVGKPRLMLDLRLGRQGTEESGWLSDSRPFRSIGALAMENQFFPVNLAAQFDVLIYFQETRPAMQLARQPSSAR